MTKPGLRLLAHTVTDTAVISACLQDAVVTAGDFHYDADRRLFAFVTNRYRHESAMHERVRAGVQIGDVTRVQMRDVPRDVPGTVLSLLSLTAVPEGDAAAILTLTFAGGAAIRLQAECINITVEDLSAPWTARGRPEHDI